MALLTVVAFPALSRYWKVNAWICSTRGWAPLPASRVIRLFGFFARPLQKVYSSD